MRRNLLLSFLALSAAACQSNTPSWHQDVKPIVDGRCIGCHKEGGIAPFSLESYEQAKSLAPQIAKAVESRRMPPWKAVASSEVKYLDDPSLTQEQIDAIVAWSNTGAEEGDAKAEVKPVAPVGKSLPRMDLELSMPRAYSPTLEPDEYRCFPITPDLAKTKYLTAFEAVPGNTKIVHHVALFLVDKDHAELPNQWDAEEPGDGYTCYGGPQGDHPADFPIVLLGGWAPGGSATVLPEGLGLAIPPGSRLVLQMHYNNPVGQSDQTKLHLTLDDSVPKPAYFMPYLKLDWALGAMPIPAGDPAVQHRYVDDPRTLFGLLAPDADLSKGFDLYGATPHMHQIGKTVRTTLVREDKSRLDLIQVDDWDFHWQKDYFFQTPVPFAVGDKVDLSCVYDNSAGHQPFVNGEQRAPRDLNWGEGSFDEMCETTLLLVPRQ